MVLLSRAEKNRDRMSRDPYRAVRWSRTITRTVVVVVDGVQRLVYSTPVTLSGRRKRTVRTLKSYEPSAAFSATPTSTADVPPAAGLTRTLKLLRKGKFLRRQKTS